MKILITLLFLLFSSQSISQEIKFFCISKVHGTNAGEWVDYQDRISILEINLENNQITMDWKVNDSNFSVSLDIISNSDGKIRALSDTWIDIPGITSMSINLDKKVFVYNTSFAKNRHHFVLCIKIAFITQNDTLYYIHNTLHFDA